MAQTISETDLLKASLSGDRDAFGLIIERYQGLVCGISFSETGNLAASEEIAQEAFIRAWRNLRQLKDLSKFRSWLLAIVRNQLRDAMSKRAAALKAVQAVEAGHGTSLSEADPSEIAINAEQQAIVWRALKAIPANYREPMVLFYRRGQSVKEVSTDLQLSEDVVKQRLSRGRKLLREEVSGLLEGVLAKTGPGRLFTAAVVASLPALAPQAASAAVAGAAIKGAAAKTTLAAGLTGAILGPILGLLGGVFGSWMSIRNTRSPRERTFMIRMTVLVAAEVLVLLTVIFTALWLSLKGIISRQAYWAIFTIFMGAHIVLLVPMIIWGNRRQQQIRQEDGTSTPPCPAPQNITAAGIKSSLGGGIIGSVAWLVVMASLAKDWLTAAATCAAAGIVFLLTTYKAPTRACGYWRRALLMLAGMLAINLTVVTARWDYWLSKLAGRPEIRQVEHLPVLAVDLIITILFVALAIMFVLRARSSRRSQ